MLKLNNKSQKKRWKESEKLFLQNNAGNMSDKDIAKALKKTMRSVRDQRQRMNIKKKGGRGIIEIDDD